MALKPEEVFTPSAPSRGETIAWEDRPETQNDLHEDLNTIGRQLCLFGETGVGKTSLAERALQDEKRSSFTISCDRDTTAKALYGKVLDGMNELRRVQRETTAGFAGKISGGIYAILRLSSQGSVQRAWTEQPWSTEPSKENICDVLRRTEISLIVDDLEKVGDKHQKGLLADCGKLMSDRSTNMDDSRIIYIGIASEADELLTLDPSIRSRLGMIRIPTMSDTQIEGLLETGFARLHLTCSQRLLQALARLSSGLPKMAHSLGLAVSREAYREKSLEISEESFANGVRSALRRLDAEFTPELRKAIGKDGDTQDIYRRILYSIATGNQDSVRLGVLERELKVELGDVMSRKTLAGYLGQLLKPGRGALLEAGSSTSSYRYKSTLMRCYVLLDSLKQEPNGIEAFIASGSVPHAQLPDEVGDDDLQGEK